jgi:hypothetical protein
MSALICSCGAHVEAPLVPTGETAAVCMVCGAVWLGRSEDCAPGYYESVLELADPDEPGELTYSDVESLTRCAAYWRRQAHRNRSTVAAVGDSVFMRPFGTVRQCLGCDCLVAGGPTRCVLCVVKDLNK